MENFITRTISIESDDERIHISRTRNTNGYENIRCDISQPRNAVSFMFTNENKNDYVAQVRELMDMLSDILYNECLIPKKETK